jgi:arylsulfatase A-like enzyme
MLPLHEKKRVTQRVAAYDVGPTILELMGVCYSPPFVWGRSLLSDVEKTPAYPTEEDFKLVSELLRVKLGSQQVGWKQIRRRRKPKPKKR